MFSLVIMTMIVMSLVGTRLNQPLKRCLFIQMWVVRYKLWQLQVRWKPYQFVAEHQSSAGNRSRIKNEHIMGQRNLKDHFNVLKNEGVNLTA